ncbi:NTE family protein [Rhizobiales bacterium GAS191]|jgi:NTE family protein|nr:NTE family protein [Rhizobiales bacterium GAS113]SEE08053.1 NTE family protein [Rhizobiales bacterium GAS191]SEE45909.1 NTE family protein [Rhizobiales bacterium GAS188]
MFQSFNAPLIVDPPQHIATPPHLQGRGIKLGLALGGGAARGWAHIGVLRALEEAGIRPQIVVGTSIGAVVGGCYAAGKLDDLSEFALQLTPARVLALLDVHVGSGLISGDRLGRRLTENLEGWTIEKLPLRFAAIATEFNTGHEIWLTRGALSEALRASYALPGIFDPRRVGGRWLMDGALVNPVPVTAARALGAEVVVAVNLSGAGYGRGTVIQDFGGDAEPAPMLDATAHPERGFLSPVRQAASRMRDLFRRRRGTPGFAQVMIDAFNITQDRITRARLAGDPPDVLASPQLGEVGLFDFHRAAEAIAAGREATVRVLPQIREIMDIAQRSFLARQRMG